MTADLNPWDEGYVPPEPNLDDKKQAASKGGKKTAQRKKRAKELNPEFDPWAPVPESANSQRLANMTEETIGPEQKASMDRFVSEYLHDFSAKKAWVRAGLSESTAQKAYEWLRTGYVQQTIKTLIDLMDEEHLVSRKDIIMGIKKEAFNHGMDSNSMARTNAFKLLAQLRGMLIKKTESKVEHKGGVMIVPMAANQDQWAQQASESQKALKQEVRK